MPVQLAKECDAVSPACDAVGGAVTQVLPLDLAGEAAEVHKYGAQADAMFGNHGVDILVNNGGTAPLPYWSYFCNHEILSRP